MSQTIRNPKTGRFEKVDDVREALKSSPVQEDPEGPQDPVPEPTVNTTWNIAQTVISILEATAHLESNLNSLGVIRGTPFNNSRDPEAECAEDEDSDSIFATGFRNVVSRLNSENSLSERPYNIVRTSVFNGLRALTFISVQGLYTFNDDSAMVEHMTDLTSRDFEGYSGLFDTENFFNELAGYARETLGSLSCSLLGYGTEHFDGEDQTNYESVSSANLRDHLMGVDNVLETVHAHLRWLNDQIETNLL